MSAILTNGSGESLARTMLNKVPEVTFFFWVIKIMCTTIGETAADYLNINLGFGLSNTTYVAGALLVALLIVQFRLRRYVPGVYWSVVVVISVFGTLITDNLTDAYNVPLTTSTIVFSDRPRAGLPGLVARRAHALDPHDRHHPPRGLLLAGDPVHVRPRHRRRRPHRREVRPRVLGLGRDLRRRHRRWSPWPTTVSGSTPCWPSGWPTSSPGRWAPRSATGSRSPATTAGSAWGPPPRATSSSGCILALVTYLSITKRDQTPREEIEHDEEATRRRRALELARQEA